MVGRRLGLGARVMAWVVLSLVMTAAMTVAAGCAGGESSSSTGSGSTCTDGARNGAEIGVDCGGGCKSCPGGACEAGDTCASGHCVDGVCCESACSGVCEACSATAKGAGEDGACGAVAAGEDPRGDCEDQGAESCDDDGACDGARKCRRYEAGTACGAAQSCEGGDQVNVDACDGAGTCVDGGTTACAPYACAGASCRTDCAADADCAAGSYCEAQVCVPLKPDGGACGAEVECASGHCVDGVCCNLACDFSCVACSAEKKGGGADGVCEVIAAGTDPDSECADEGATSCGLDGSCDGSGACRFYEAGTPCGDTASCTDGVQVTPDACAGPGMCMDGGTLACGAFKCDLTSCRTTYAQEFECVDGAYCSPGSLCLAKKGAGQVCTDDSQCLSTNCLIGLPGTFLCSCGGNEECSTLQYCFSPFCAPRKPNNSACTADNQCLSDRCVGDPLKCDVCVDSAGCFASHYCVTGECVARKQGGADCTLGEECLTGNCSGSPGVCDPCDAGIPCAATHYCDANSLCQVQKSKGSICASDAECAAGYCNLNVNRCN